MADFGTSRTGKMSARTVKRIFGMAIPLRRSGFISGRRGRLEVLRGKATASGRNEPCPCGSGRKYKKCCLVRG
jgi:uncharacterized protein YecA (UPF0149 family)